MKPYSPHAFRFHLNLNPKPCSPHAVRFDGLISLPPPVVPDLLLSLAWSGVRGNKDYWNIVVSCVLAACVASTCECIAVCGVVLPLRCAVV